MSRLHDVTPQAAADLLHGGEAVLVDVREPEEWAEGHADGARHAPLSTLDPAAIDVEKAVVAVCRSGRRSGKAADQLAATHTVHNMDGGMTAWAEAELPVVKSDGTPGSVK